MSPPPTRVHGFVPGSKELIHTVMVHDSDYTSFAFAPFKQYMGSCFVFEQQDQRSSLETSAALQQLREKYSDKFVSWSPNGVKTAYSREMIFPKYSFVSPKQSLTAFFNTSNNHQISNSCRDLSSNKAAFASYDESI